MKLARISWFVPSIALLGVIAFLFWRHQQIIGFYRTAMWGGTAEAKSAVARLAGFRGEDATELLLRIASPRQRFLDNRQVLAVQLLAKRGRPEIAVRLAESLKPQAPYSLRMAVATALAQIECNEQCTQYVLHYLYRRFCGELNAEEAFPESDADARFQLKQDEDQLAATLNTSLLVNRRWTVVVLTEVYGLGSEYPSPFSLHVVESLKLREACSALRDSSAKTFDVSLRGSIQSLVQKLECPGAKFDPTL